MNEDDKQIEFVERKCINTFAEEVWDDKDTMRQLVEASLATEDNSTVNELIHQSVKIYAKPTNNNIINNNNAGSCNGQELSVEEIELMFSQMENTDVNE